MTAAAPVPFAVVGPGAVGGLLAALLHKQGLPVTAVGRAITVRTINRHGIRVRSAQFGDFWSDVPASEDVPPGADVVLAVKAYALPGVLATVAAGAPRSVLAVPNGVSHPDALARALPGVPVACGSVTIETARLADATIEHRSAFARLSVGVNASGWATVAALGAAGLELIRGGTESEVLWRKFRFLSPFALLTAFWNEPLGAALAQDRALTDAVVEEVAAVATAEGLPTAPMELRAILAGLPPAMRSSLQREMEDGVSGELDALGSDLIRLAEHHSLPAVATARIVHELERRVAHANEPAAMSGPPSEEPGASTLSGAGAGRGRVCQYSYADRIQHGDLH